MGSGQGEKAVSATAGPQDCHSTYDLIRAMDAGWTVDGRWMDAPRISSPLCLLLVTLSPLPQTQPCAWFPSTRYTVRLCAILPGFSGLIGANSAVALFCPQLPRFSGIYRIFLTKVLLIL